MSVAKSMSIRKSTETVVLSVIEEKHAKIKTSELVRKYQQKFLNKDWTLKDWNEMQKIFSEKELILHFFDSSRTAYEMYKKCANEKPKMLKYVENELDPHHITPEDLNDFYRNTSSEKASTMNDHMPVVGNDKSKLGDINLEFKLDIILMNNFSNYEFTAEGLQTYASTHGHFITLRNAKQYAIQVNKILHKNKVLNARKSGIVDMENEMEHVIKRFCKENHIPIEVSNALLLRGKKIIKMMCENSGRNVGEALTSNTKEGLVKRFARSVRNQLEYLEINSNDFASMLVKEDG